MLKKFLNEFKFNYIFKSSTDTYKKGLFNDALLLVLEKYEQIMEIVLPTLGKERQKTYSPFLPICPETGKVLEVQIIEIKKKEGKIIYKGGEKKIETEVTNGKCKLQWKVDWAMRWFAFDVDYEMYGKDLIESAILSSKICKSLGKKSPNGFAYEMFLDEKGEKISKSKGNGITIEQWLNYASPESLSLYMYQNPKRAKKLYADVVPKAVDEYLTCIDKFDEQDNQQRLLNPVWHIHNGNPPKEKSIMPFSVLLNLVGTSNATDKEVLWKFIKRYKKDIKISNHPILDSLVKYALKYFVDIVKPNKKYKKPDEKEKKALKDLVSRLKACKDQTDPETIQTLVYSVGKDNGYEKNLREWFKAIYEIIFGSQDGPRMGFFISFFGIKESIELINKYIE
jgi:lysyl-tRNA synthetase class 1